MYNTLANKNTLSLFLVVMWFIMSYIIYDGMVIHNNSYFQVWMPSISLCIIAYIFHKYDIGRDGDVLFRSLMGSIAIGYSAMLGVILWWLFWGVLEITFLTIFQVALLGGLWWVLLFGVAGVLEDLLGILVVLLLGSDLWVTIEGDLLVVLWADLWIKFSAISTTTLLSIVIWLTLAGILLNFYLNYRKIYSTTEIDMDF